MGEKCQKCDHVGCICLVTEEIAEAALMPEVLRCLSEIRKLLAENTRLREREIAAEEAYDREEQRRWTNICNL